jgi:hypothetical protein
LIGVPAAAIVYRIKVKVAAFAGQVRIHVAEILRDVYRCSGGSLVLQETAGNCRKLRPIYGKCGFRCVKCEKCVICKPKSCLSLRLLSRLPSEWGSGGRGFKSRRPDLNKEQPVALDCGGLFLFEYPCIAVRVRVAQMASSGWSFLANRWHHWYNVLLIHKLPSSNPVATFAPIQ